MWGAACLVVFFAASLQGQDGPKKAEDLASLVAEGIGRRFPADQSPSSFHRWPTTLHPLVGAMMSSALSPDGTLLATGNGHDNSSGQISVWDVSSGKPLFVKHLNRGIRRLAFLPDGQSFVAAGYDGVARQLDSRTGQMIRELRGHTDAINAVAVSPDGSRLATGGHDDQVVIWDMTTGKPLSTLKGHADDVLTVAFVPNEPLLVAAGRDVHIRVWNLETGKVERELAGPTELVEDVAVSVGGDIVAAASWDGHVWLWETGSGRLLGKLETGSNKACSVAFSPRGDFLASGAFDGHITVWDYGQRARITRFPAHSGAVFGLSFRENGEQFASNGWGGDAKLWNSNGTPVASFVPRAENPPSQSAAWSPDESRVAIVKQSGGVQVVDPNTGLDLLRIPDVDGRECVGFANDGNLLIARTDGFLSSRDATGQEVAKYPGFTTGLAAMQMADEGRSVVGIDFDGTAAIYLIPKKTLMVLAAKGVVGIAAHRSVTWVATSHEDGTVRFWNAATGASLPGEITIKQGAPRGMCISPAGNELVCVVSEGALRYAIESRDDTISSPGPTLIPSTADGFLSAAFNGTGTTLLAGTIEKSLRGWNKSGIAGPTFKRDGFGPFTQLIPAPRSDRLLTIDGGRVSLWDPEEAQEAIAPLAVLADHGKGARAVCFAEDDRVLVTGSFDSRAWSWSLATGDRRPLRGKHGSSAVTVVPGAAEVVLGYFNNTMFRVNLEDQEVLLEYSGIPSGPYSLDVSRDRTRLVAAFQDRGLKVFDLTKPAPVVSLPPDELPYTYAAFSPDGASFVSCTGDWKKQTLPGKVRLHDSATGEVRRLLAGHEGEVKFAAFDAEGKRVASTAADRKVRVHDVATGEPLAVLSQSASAFCAAFVPGSDLLLTGDYRGHIILWNLKTQKQAQVVPAHADWIQRVAFSRDLTVLATASRDGTVRLWKFAGEGNERRVVSPDR